jgi:predicted RNase H-like HicB family nuclease
MPKTIAFHIESLRLHGEPVPEPKTKTYTVEVA